MSERISAQPSANVAGSAKAERLRLMLVAGGIVFALAFAVVALRFQRLSELPPGLHFDEGVHGVDALQVLQGEHAVFFPAENDGLEGLMAYAVALGTSLLGRTVLAVRLPAALASAGAVFVVFWLGRLLFGRDEESGRATPWRGLLIGGVGAGLLAVSLGQTIIGRTAFRANFLPLLLSLCLALLWWGWRQRVRRRGSWWRVVLAGVCAGLLPYTYLAAHFTPFLFLSFGLSFALPFGSAAKARVRAALPWIGIFLGVAGLVAAPILVYFILHPEDFFSRSSQLLVFHPSRSQGDPLRAFLVNVWEHLLAFGFRGDLHWYHNFVGQPMLNPGEAFFFWLGVGMAVWRWQRPPYRLLLLWLGVLLLPAMLARDSVPHTLRMIGAAPAIYLLVAAGVWEALRFLRDRFFRQNETRAAIAVGIVVSGLILIQGVLTYRTYFQKWAAAPELDQAYEVEWQDLVRVLNAQPPNADIVYLIPDGQRHLQLKEGFRSHTFDYLYQGAAPAFLFHTAMPDLAQKIESTLAAMEDLSTVKVVEWTLKAVWTGDEIERFAFLLGKYGRYLDSEEYGSFRVHNYVEVSLERPWIFYEHLEPLAVHYDGGISLQGLALGQGEEQLPSRPLLNLGQDRPLWLALRWQTSPGLDIDYSISVRLHDAEGGGVYQKDAVLWKPDHTFTGGGGPSELFDTLLLLDFPADLPPGEYELRLIIYDSETLKPTVELDVWEMEFVLARLRLAEAQ